ncbi:lipoprotein [Kitasatospora putterlickiae]|uniref:Lipoprotein n=1 Tax=Kitasatospora putterlickiae TaxID=221725 RepID=A0ABN1XMZ3_9ACTN
MSTTARRTPGRPIALLLAAVPLALAVGCAASGELRDHGAATPVTPSPASIPLWPGQATAPPPDFAADRAPEPTPQPVPDLTVAGQDVTSVDVRTLLTKDPGVSQEERRALEPCAGCEIRDPEYRDLTGDGRPELLVVVGLSDVDVLHVYTPSGDRLLPVLRVQQLKRFGAETIGTDLWLYEPTTSQSRTSRLYRWDGVRLVLADQKVQGIRPTPEPEPTPSAERPIGATRSPGPGNGAAVSPVPMPPVPPVRRSAAPDPAVPTLKEPWPVRPVAPTATPPARPETTP